MNVILDSSAIIAYLANEPGAEVVDELLKDVENAVFVHAVNLCEVFYEVARLAGQDKAKAVTAALRNAGISTREDMDTGFWQDAGLIKADYRKVSLADCICAALAARIGGEVVTADREFQPLAQQGVCNVRFIR